MSPLHKARVKISATLATVIAGVALLTAGIALIAVAPASASTTQLAMFEDPNIQYQNPGLQLLFLRSLGVDILRVPVGWDSVAPDPSSTTAPQFDAGDPAAYPASGWAPYDTLIKDAAADGIAVDLMPTGGAPLWATASGAPPCNTIGGKVQVCYSSDYFPSAADYGQFVKAVATRYSGSYIPAGSTSPLPRASFWELWNEANWGPSLTPQYDGSSVPVSANTYRGLFSAGWTALQQTGHGGDTIIASGLSQDGSAHVGERGTSAPLTFLRTLYCVNASYHELRGAAAREAGCPTSKAGYRTFRADNPELFKLSGVGIHPYPYGKPPTVIQYPNPNDVEFAEIPRLMTTIDRLQKVYGSRLRPKIYNTEYGYLSGYTTPQNEAKYLNEAEYLSWKNPRIASFDQFQLFDDSWFPSGLVNSDNQPKPNYYSYQLPIWLPVTSTKRGRALEVWGAERAAHFAAADGHGTQYVSIQFERRGSRRYRTLRRVRITNPRGYFEVAVKFPRSGAVRLAWEYPSSDPYWFNPFDSGDWIYSRVTGVSLH
jgi:hypothetical protein